jgi:hypothetical protein
MSRGLATTKVLVGSARVFETDPTSSGDAHTVQILSHHPDFLLQVAQKHLPCRYHRLCLTHHGICMRAELVREGFLLHDIILWWLFLSYVTQIRQSPTFELLQ